MELFLQAFCLFLVIRSGESIKCHLCNTETNRDCGDPFNSDNSLRPVECTPDSLKTLGSAIDDLKTKMKAFGVESIFRNLGLDTKVFQQVPDISKAICQKVKVQVKDRSMTVRTCALPDTDTFDSCSAFEKSVIDSPDSKVTFCELCSHEGCNGASGVLPGSLLVTFLAALSLIAAIFKVY